ncbi:MAG: YggS family pyridoxal phosphate-dependent enzyme [Verrucomicrobia bacterium]|nr:YggS family pyridoxal phosphate-dependent enzyme [Verrucomicrobiota bacterium]MDA1087604.1 YggS family pyridoxal phosphate-dependent enzyme [Verrucomicrobiota bacterium]
MEASLTATDESFPDRLARVRLQIEEACARAGRHSDEVQLLGVTKKKDPDCIEEASQCGLWCFGESRVQEARQKIAICSSSLEWHLIGHLQGNKVRDAAELFHTIHSIDSEKLMRLLNDACETAGKTMSIYVQVNLAGEASKSGLSPDAVESALTVAMQCHRLDVIGLMTIPPFTPEPEDSRPYFEQLRMLSAGLATRSGLHLSGLSMGMSHDFSYAIEEGSTCVRIGTALFGGRRTRTQELEAGGKE